MTATGSNRPGRASARTPRPEPAARGIRTQEPGARAPRRVPFAVLIVAILGGGLCALLTLNTALAASEVRQRNLDAANDALNDREQQLAREVAALQAPAALARRAAGLGLVPADAPAFLRIGRDGSVTVLGHPAPASAAVPDPTPKSTPKTTGPKTTGPKTTGPKTTGPKTTGPKTTGPKTTGPKTTGPKTTGPRTTGRAGATTRPATSPSTPATPRDTPLPAPTRTPTVTLPGGPR